jgi:lysophospholipase L1-like esterase
MHAHNAPMSTTRTAVVYAALGDSMSIDDYAGGPGRGAASLLWRNRDEDFPAWIGRDLTTRDPAARLALLATDGATSTTVASQQLARLRRLPGTPTLATVTMGGNDLLAAYGDQPTARRAIRTVAANGRLVLAGLRNLLGADHRALVADVHARFLGHGLAAGDPTLPAARPPDRGLWYRELFEPNAWGASQIRAAFWETLQTHGAL